MAAFISMMQQAFVDQLHTHCRDPFPEEDPSRLGLAVRNDLQDDPTVMSVAEVHHQHPKVETWRDGELRREIGGGIHRVRRFTIRIQAFFTGMEKNEANDAAMLMLARMEHALNLPYPSVVDEFGEKLVFVRSTETETEPGGGPPEDFNYEWWVKVELWTFTP